MSRLQPEHPSSSSGGETVTSAEKMERKFFVGGNWKMNGSRESIGGIMTFLKQGPLSPDSGELA